MELRQLRVFIAVAEERSFTRAAARLFLAQSAVSASVQVLERELDALLIDRSVQPVALTAAGQTFLNYARQTIASADAAVQVVRNEPGGTVALGFMNARRSDVLSVPAIVTNFRKAHPSITVTARHVGGSITEAEHVRDGHLDLAILSLAGTQISGVRTRPLYDEAVALVCHREHRSAGRQSVSVDDLAKHDLVGLPHDWGVTLAVEHWRRQRALELRIGHIVNDVGALLDFASAGEASVLLPPSFVSAHPDLVIVPIDSPPMFVTELATPSRRLASPACTAFAAWVHDRVRRHLRFEAKQPILDP